MKNAHLALLVRKKMEVKTIVAILEEVELQLKKMGMKNVKNLKVNFFLVPPLLRWNAD